MSDTEKMECMRGEGFAVEAVLIQAVGSREWGVGVKSTAWEMGDRLFIYFLNAISKMLFG